MAISRETADCGPSFDDIVGGLALTEAEAIAWTVEYRGSFQTPDKPLGLPALLNFGYGLGMGTMSDEAYEEINDALDDARDRALAQWIQRAAVVIPVEERVAAAVELAASWWLPVLAQLDAQNAQEVAQLLGTAAALSRNPALPRDALKEARDTRVGLPPSRPPPPYVGHFCAAVMHLLDAMIDPPNYDDLAQSLGFTVVAPDGSRRTNEIAGTVTG